MPDIEISKFKARRGTDQQRKLIVFDQGEFAYTVDTKRLFSGDGNTLGGVAVGNKIHPPLLNTYSLSTLNAQVGDVVTVDNIFYQLLDPDYTDINNWEQYILNVDPVIFSFDGSNTLYINASSIPASYLNPTYVSNGIKIDSGILQSNFNTKSLEISAYKLSMKVSGINEREISSTTFINGISGGSNAKIGIKATPNQFYFDNNEMKLSGYNPFILRFQDLPSYWFGPGLNYNTSVSSISTTLVNVDASNTIVRNSTGGIGINPTMFGSGLYLNTSGPTLSTTLTNVDGISLLKDSLGNISIKNDAVSGTNELAKITVDQFGRVTTQSSSIFGALTGNSTLGNNNIGNSLSAIFNGTPSHSLSGAIPGLQITQFTAVSSNGATVTLSSAGFITFEGGFPTRNGQMVGRFAIPIFTY
jgi:hypothetical protein